MEKNQQTSLKNALSKEEIDKYFQQIFKDQSNVQCFQCGKNSKQWTDCSHAIFLCLNCASCYKQMKQSIEIKSIGLDLWSKKELETLLLGGNRRFKQFLAHYQLQKLPYQQIFKTKAAQYYRILLLEEANGHQAPEAPTKQQAQKIVRGSISFTEMSPEQMLEYTKQKALWLGAKTKQLGSKAVVKIQQKVSSGQLKQDAKNMAKSVKTKAENLWKFAVFKVKQLKKNKEQKEQKKLLNL